MAKADFYPVTDANKLLYLDNLVTGIGTVGATVGLLPADITARTNRRNAGQARQEDRRAVMANHNPGTLMVKAVGIR